MTELHPVEVNRQKQEFITGGKVYKSWMEAMIAAKEALQNNRSVPE